MIDFHTHILPKVDDGSADAVESTAMLQEEMRQEVDTIVATPHFYANRISIEGFLHDRDNSVRTWSAYLNQREDIFDLGSFRGIFLGAEVYYFPGIGRAEKLSELAIRGTKTILIEMPFVQWTEDMVTELRDILNRQQLEIVLAHVERYPEFQKDKRIWEQVMSLPLTLQLNGGCFTHGRARRKFGLGLLQERDNVILGSDCHNMSSRRPNLKEAREIIAKKLGADRLERIDALSQHLIEKTLKE